MFYFLAQNLRNTYINTFVDKDELTPDGLLDRYKGKKY